jgi:hypothetical protein
MPRCRPRLHDYTLKSCDRDLALLVSLDLSQASASGRPDLQQDLGSLPKAHPRRSVATSQRRCRTHLLCFPQSSFRYTIFDLIVA